MLPIKHFSPSFSHLFSPWFWDQHVVLYIYPSTLFYSSQTFLYFFSSTTVILLKQTNMGTACGYGGGMVDALNANFYGNGTQTLVLAHGYIWHWPNSVALSYSLPCMLLQGAGFWFGFRPKCKAFFSLWPKEVFNFWWICWGRLVCLLDELNLKKTIYVGHSMSAMIGCIAATKKPELFEHLVQLGGSPRWLHSLSNFV